MTVERFYICYETSLEPEEIELLHKYWQFSDDSQNPYRYTVKELISILNFEVAPKITSFVGSNCFITSTSLAFNCKSCTIKFFARTRKDLSKLKSNLPGLCVHCGKEEINLKVQERLQFLESTIQKPTFQKFRHEDIHTLSYLDKIILFILISEFNPSEEEPIKTPPDMLNLTGAKDKDGDFLSSLKTKKAICIVDNGSHQNNIVINARNFIRFNIKNLSAENTERFRKYISEVSAPGIYVRKPDEYNKLDDFAIFLYKEIMNATIMQSDVMAISQIVESMLLSKAYLLVNEVKKQHRIPIEMSLKIDIVLAKLVDKYSLLKINNILNFQAMRVAAALYSDDEIPFDKQKRMYGKYIENYIIYLDNNKKTHQYETQLPDHVSGSQLEYFTSHYILGTIIGWSGFSGEEIKQKWLNSHTINQIIP